MKDFRIAKKKRIKKKVKEKKEQYQKISFSNSRLFDTKSIFFIFKLKHQDISGNIIPKTLSSLQRKMGEKNE